jgi:hypothetical protein
MRGGLGEAVCNLRRREVQRDGNCLFHAATVAASPEEFYNMVGDEEMRHAEQLRADAVALMRRDEDKQFSAFLTGDFDAYLREMLRSGTWGGEPELRAIAGVKQRPVHVYVERVGGYVCVCEYGGEQARGEAIRVLFDSKHYDALMAGS